MKIYREFLKIHSRFQELSVYLRKHENVVIFPRLSCLLMSRKLRYVTHELTINRHKLARKAKILMFELAFYRGEVTNIYLESLQFAGNSQTF